MDWQWHVKSLTARAAVRLLKATGWYDGYFNHWRQFFDYAEGQGLHIFPVHHYTPLPDTQRLAESLWSEKRILPAVDLREAAAIAFLKTLLPKYRSECAALRQDKSSDPHEYSLDNEAFGRGDADILYALVRSTKPRKIIEIGSGYSTLLISQALRANAREAPDYTCEFVAIEPYPPAYINPPPAEVTRLEPRMVQDVPLAEFESLKAGDILFIDSSHTVKIGSDTNYEFLSILPVLAPGVLIHVHDIFTPFDYPRQWIRESRFFWNEQYLLEAFLSFNSGFEVILPLHAISRNQPDILRDLIPGYEPDRHRVASFWMRRR